MSEVGVTLPHERELLELVEMIWRAHGDSDYLGVMITDTHQHAEYLISKVRDATTWDKGHVKVFRDGVEVKGGGKVRVASYGYPGALMGLRPTEVKLMGKIGELFYMLQMFQKIEAVA